MSIKNSTPFVKTTTKLETILINRSMKQTDLIELMEYTVKKNNFNIKIPARDRTSKIVTGKQKNYTIKTAVLIAKTLNVSLEEIIEDNLLKTK